MSSYRYTNLTSAVKDKGSPLRHYLDRRFPDTRPLQADYRSRVGRLLVEGGSADPGTLGAAFDLQVRLRLDPRETPVVAMLAFMGSPDALAAITEVVRRGREVARCGGGQETVSRACWALALCTEVYRVGLVPGSPLAELLAAGRFTAEALLGLAPPDALRQLSELEAVAATKLLPCLHAPLHLGPTFDGSRLCAADADLIASGLLLDIKTHLGRKDRKTGRRSDALALTDLYQVLTYALFDSSDNYRIDSIGIYSARYGSLVTWPLAEALQTLAGRPVDLAQERSEVWSLLGGKGR